MVQVDQEKFQLPVSKAEIKQKCPRLPTVLCPIALSSLHSQFQLTVMTELQKITLMSTANIIGKCWGKSL
jgi:hypothetical protein